MIDEDVKEAGLPKYELFPFERGLSEIENWVKLQTKHPVKFHNSLNKITQE